MLRTVSRIIWLDGSYSERLFDRLVGSFRLPVVVNLDIQKKWFARSERADWRATLLPSSHCTEVQRQTRRLRQIVDLMLAGLVIYKHKPQFSTGHLELGADNFRDENLAHSSILDFELR